MYKNRDKLYRNKVNSNKVKTELLNKLKIKLLNRHLSHMQKEMYNTKTYFKHVNYRGVHNFTSCLPLVLHAYPTSLPLSLLNVQEFRVHHWILQGLTLNLGMRQMTGKSHLWVGWGRAHLTRGLLHTTGGYSACDYSLMNSYFFLLYYHICLVYHPLFTAYGIFLLMDLLVVILQIVDYVCLFNSVYYF